MSSLLLLTALLGCASTDPEEPSGPAEDSVLLTDANNYQSVSMLSIPVVPTMPGADLRVCYDAVLKDIQCHDVVPAMDIDNVALTRFKNATQEQVAQKLVGSHIGSGDYDVYRDVHTVDGETCVQTAAMGFLGSPVNLAEDYKVSPADTYLMTFTRGTALGLGTLTMVFVQPVEGETNTTVNAPTGCNADETSGLLTFTPNLALATPVAFPAGKTKIDWSEVTRDGAGGDIKFAEIDRVLVGFYAGKTVADLEAEIFDLELNATSMWQLMITGGENADLSLAVERTTQAPFTGFDRTDGVWIIALMCATCQNPAPIVLSIVQPQAAVVAP